MLRIFTSRRCLDHAPSGGYPEVPERLSGILDHLSHAEGFGETSIQEVDGRDEAARERAEAAVRALHEEGYVDRLRRAVERGDGLFDSADNPLSSGTWDAAMAAVETVLAAADWIFEGEGSAGAEGAGRQAFAAVRPPGHHAERGQAMGFCYFANIAVAADELIRRRKAGRVAIYDFDVHHGNGTQHLFEERSDVVFVSSHQYPFYPGTGAASERGIGAGEGATVNIPLAAGTGDETFLERLEDEVLPAIREAQPDLLMLSAGFDAWKGDPLGGLQVTEEGYREMSLRLGRLAREVCGGRVLSVLEGGYDLTAVPRLVEIHLKALRQGVAGE